MSESKASIACTRFYSSKPRQALIVRRTTRTSKSNGSDNETSITATSISKVPKETVRTACLTPALTTNGTPNKGQSTKRSADSDTKVTKKLKVSVDPLKHTDSSDGHNQESSSFLLLRADAACSDPPLWRMTNDRKMLQKYVPLNRHGKKLHIQSSVYTGWASTKEDYYSPVTVTTVDQTSKQHIVEFHRDSISKTVNPGNALGSIPSIETKNVTSISQTATTSTTTASSASTNNPSNITETNVPTPLAAVTQALKALAKDKFHYRKKIEASSETAERDFFCFESSFLTKDINVTVNNVGSLVFPLSKFHIDKTIEVLSKLNQDKTLLNTDTINTATTTASKLLPVRVLLNKQVFADLLDKVAGGLNISKGSSLIAQYNNMMICSQSGQCLKTCEQSKNLQNKVATLMFVLPTVHKGGELIIQHKKKKHLFFASRNPDIIKCVAFYLDCNDEMKTVTEGYCVTLSYNVFLQPPIVADINNIDSSLNLAVAQYFAAGATKLVFSLNNGYSKDTLKWHLLKDTDLTRAAALFTVAKKQNRVPCLALANHEECYDVDTMVHDEPVLINSKTNLYFWVDKNNMQFENPEEFAEDSEICYTSKTKDLFKANEVKASMSMKNGYFRTYWFERACIVLWSNKGVFFHGFKTSLIDLHKLTTQSEMRSVLHKLVYKEWFFQKAFWKKPGVSDMLIDIVVYLNEAKLALYVLQSLSSEVLNEDRIDRFIQLEKQFDDKTWAEMLRRWKKKRYFGLVQNLNKSLSFINKYMDHTCQRSNSVIITGILEEAVKVFIEKNKDINEDLLNERTKEETIEQMSNLMKICVDLGNTDMETTLIDHVISHCSSYPAVTLGELYCRFDGVLRPELLAVLKPVAERAIAERLSLLNDESMEDMSLPICSPCNCKHCNQVTEFFSSKTERNLVVRVTKKLKDHIENTFSSYKSDLFSITCNTVNRRSELVFKKSLPHMLEVRRQLKNKLVEYKEILQKVSEPDPLAFDKVEPAVTVKVEQENDDIKFKLEEDKMITEDATIAAESAIEVHPLRTINGELEESQEEFKESIKIKTEELTMFDAISSKTIKTELASDVVLERHQGFQERDLECQDTIKIKTEELTIIDAIDSKSIKTEVACDIVLERQQGFQESYLECQDAIKIQTTPDINIEELSLIDGRGSPETKTESETDVVGLIEQHFIKIEPEPYIESESHYNDLGQSKSSVKQTHI